MFLRRPLLFRLTCLLFALALPVALAQSGSGAPLTVEEVLKLSQGGFSDDLIITRIKKNAKPFDLSAEELIVLRQAGLSDNIIRFLLDPSQPYTPPPASAPPKPDISAPSAAQKPSKKYPPDVHAAAVPPEAGLYRFQGDTPMKIDLKIVLGEKEGPGLGKLMMKKEKITGYLLGPTARMRTTEASPIFYMRMPEGKGVEEIVLATLSRKNGRRELDLGPRQELKADIMKPFDTLEIGPSLFRITTVSLKEGEYLFLYIGSADPSKGGYGKGFDFGVDTPKSQKKATQ